MKYTNDDYIRAIDLALNYPVDFSYRYYSQQKDLFIVDVMDGGWYYGIKLQGSFVRSCLKWVKNGTVNWCDTKFI